MMIFLPYIGSGLFVLAIVGLCFWMDHQRTSRIAFHQGWEACERNAIAEMHQAAKAKGK